jgi:hypothetical protein
VLFWHFKSGVESCQHQIFHLVMSSRPPYGYVETRDARYIPTILDRGADALVAAGRIGGEVAAALKAEARRRIAAGRFFAHIAYASLVARLSS